MILAATLSILSNQNLVNAQIKVTPPANWEPDSDNNPDAMRWHQKSTNSILAMLKAAEKVPFSLAEVAAGLAQYGGPPLLEHTDELSFGQSNYGYRFFLNLSSSLVSERLSGTPLEGLISDMVHDTNNRPFKGMLILAEKQGGLYVITLLSPRDNFDSVLKELEPTIDSIQLT